jgi:predicted nucleic acid-binding protein
MTTGALIAETAVGLGLELATFNTKHYSRPKDVGPTDPQSVRD